MNAIVVVMLMIHISDYDSVSDCKDVGSDDIEEIETMMRRWYDNFFSSIYYKKWVWLFLPWQEIDEDKIIR